MAHVLLQYIIVYLKKAVFIKKSVELKPQKIINVSSNGSEIKYVSAK